MSDLLNKELNEGDEAARLLAIHLYNLKAFETTKHATVKDHKYTITIKFVGKALNEDLK